MVFVHTLSPSLPVRGKIITNSFLKFSHVATKTILRRDMKINTYPSKGSQSINASRQLYFNEVG